MSAFFLHVFPGRYTTHFIRMCWNGRKQLQIKTKKAFRLPLSYQNTQRLNCIVKKTVVLKLCFTSWAEKNIHWVCENAVQVSDSLYQGGCIIANSCLYRKRVKRETYKWRSVFWVIRHEWPWFVASGVKMVGCQWTCARNSVDLRGSF